MAKVEGCVTSHEVMQVHRFLQEDYGQDLADIWDFGCQTALRVSDVRSIKFEDFDKRDNTIKLYEKKTNKYRVIDVNERALQLLERRKQENPKHIYLFQSLGSNRSKERIQPYHRNTVYRAFSAVGKQLRLKLGSHSMRKSRCTVLYREHNVSLDHLRRILNHSSIDITVKYLSINPDEIKKVNMIVV